MRKRKYLKPEEKQLENKLIAIWEDIYREHEMNPNTLKFPPMTVVMIGKYLKAHKITLEDFKIEVEKLPGWKYQKGPNLWGLSSETFCNEWIFQLSKSANARKSIEVSKQKDLVNPLMTWLHTWAKERKLLGKAINIDIALSYAEVEGKTNGLNKIVIEEFKQKAESFIQKYK